MQNVNNEMIFLYINQKKQNQKRQQQKTLQFLKSFKVFNLKSCSAILTIVLAR